MRARRCFINFLLAVVAMTPATACVDRRHGGGVDDSGPPVRGGTLKLVGTSDVDRLASTSAYSVTSLGMLWIFTRQLVTYPLSKDFETASRVVPDLAEALPTMDNGGISADGRTYTFHLRRGVLWNTSPPREVNAHDLARGIKLICNPVAPAGAPGYYTSTIAGMEEYCGAFAKIPGAVADIRNFVEEHKVAGVQTPDEFTVIFRLVQPASDFLNILAMPFASPVPVEYLNYLPDAPDFRQNTISNGPYQIVKYTPNREIQFERNPVWSAASDPSRPAYVDHISIVVGIDQQLTQLQIEAGTADLSFGDAPPTSEIAALLEIGDPNLMLTPPGEYFSGFYYLSVNMAGPEKEGPLLNPDVRLALQYAVNKAAIAQVQGGPQVSRPAQQAVSSAVTGYRAGAGMYQTAMDRGDPEKARQLLAQAGYPNGLSLKLAYVQSTTPSLIAQTLQESFRRAGIDLQLTSYTAADYYGRLLDNADNARRGVWDLALAGWFPDWNGANNSRSVIQPLFDGRNFGHGSSAYGGYNSKEVNSLIDRALATPAFADAETLWAEAASRVLKDMAIVPLVEFKLARYRSARVRNCLLNMWSLNCDMTAVWLNDASAPGSKP